MRQVPSKILLIGQGRMGKQLSFLFADSSHVSIESHSWRNFFSEQTNQSIFADFDYIFLCGRDQEIEKQISESLNNVREKCVFFSAGLSLKGIKRIHPLMTFSSERLLDLRTWNHIPLVTTDEASQTLAKSLFENKVLQIPVSEMSKYHAIAVATGNLIQLLCLANLKELPGELRASDFAPLLKQSLSNILESPQRETISGPLSRNESGTVQRYSEQMNHSQVADFLRGSIELYKEL